MPKERLIAHVNNNADKYRTYQYLMSKYNKAIKYGFYFEAIPIDYSMLEDRLSSFLYHIGIRKNRKSYKFDNTKLTDLYRGLIKKYVPKESDKLTINTISGKIKIVRATAEWAKDGYPGADTTDYLSVMWSVYQRDGMDPDNLLRLLSEIDTWRDYRNEIIHALLNKNINSINDNLAQEAKHGMMLARELDNVIKVMKGGNRIRRSLKLGKE